MQEKHARLTVLIDPKMKRTFEKLCLSEELTASHMVRALIQQYLDHHEADKKKPRKART